MKGKFFIGISALLLVVSLFIGWKCLNVKAGQDYLQAQIDLRFAQSFSSLYSDLFQTDNQPLTEDLLLSLGAHSYFCCSIFSLTSYADDLSLHEIVFSLSKMAPIPHAEYEKIVEATLIRDIGYLSSNLSSPEREALAKSIWTNLSAQLERQG